MRDTLVYVTLLAMRALVLMSGGLDSTLAAKLILDQGIELQGLHFTSVFCTCSGKNRTCTTAVAAARQLGIPVRIIDNTRDLLEIVRHPGHGYGGNLNPCLDCRILAFRKAREMMALLKAAFVVTGEVLNERPMSQNLRAMRLIEKEAGLEGLVVRPLSAALLEPSVPEGRGWVDRSRLLSISGRCRRPQMALAESLGIRDYPCPAGGCRLTDPGFAARMRDLIEHVEKITVNDVNLLKVGRHFRLSESVKAVVGRNEAENSRLNDLAQIGDVVMMAADFPGPVTLVRGHASLDLLTQAAAITAYYGKGRDRSQVVIRFGRARETEPGELTVAPIAEPLLGQLRIPQLSGDDVLAATRLVSQNAVQSPVECAESSSFDNV
ncbi:MAG: hypothetical protein ACUVWX_10830 [Kiritimatiellia bacterium]